MKTKQKDALSAEERIVTGTKQSNFTSTLA
jgi:hypothetical protein